MLSDKVVVVTGGAGLLGSSFCEAIVSNDGMVVIAEIDKQKAQGICDQFNKRFNNKAFAIEMDITNVESVENAVIELSRNYPTIDAVVNNAYPRNKNYGNHFFDVTYDDFCQNTSMNLGGYFLVSQQFMKFFYQQGFGNIINMASIYGAVPPRFQIYKDTKMTTPVEYSVIKSGLIHLTKYMAKYAKGKNIRVNSISPGGILDNQAESFLEAYESYCINKGMLSPEDICGALVFLLSDAAKFVNGQNLIVDDGFTL